MEKSVFAFSDYRDFLSSVYKHRKKRTSYFSYEYLAMKSGIKSRSYIYRIMKGERSLSIASCIKLAKALELSQADSDYFFYLVCLNQSSTDEEKVFFTDKLHSLRNNRVELNYGS